MCTNFQQRDFLVVLKSIQDRLDAELASGVHREDVIGSLVNEYQRLNSSFQQIPALRDTAPPVRAFPAPVNSGN